MILSRRGLSFVGGFAEKEKGEKGNVRGRDGRRENISEIKILDTIVLWMMMN